MMMILCAIIIERHLKKKRNLKSKQSVKVMTVVTDLFYKNQVLKNGKTIGSKHGCLYLQPQQLLTKSPIPVEHYLYITREQTLYSLTLMM